jgi:signal transduction histidine kinase
MKDSHRSILQLMQECGSTLHQILNDVLDFSKIEANQLRIENIEFEPQDLIGSTVDFLRTKAKARNVDLQLEYLKSEKRSASGQKVIGDPTRLKQVLWNLIDNAIKFRR